MTNPTIARIWRGAIAGDVALAGSDG